MALKIHYIAFIGGLWFALISCAEAQFSRSQTDSGLFGSRTLGGGISSRGSTAFGSFGSGGAAGSIAAAPGSRTQQGLENVGSLQGNERFLREARQPGAFVGADSGDTQAFNSMVGAGGLSGIQNTFNRFQQQQRRNVDQPNANQGRRSQQIQVPIQLRIGWNAPSVPDGELQSKLATRLQRTLQVRSPTGAAVTVQGRIVTLRGIVATEHGKVLASRLAMLEPGVSEVRNELVVAPPPQP